MLESVHTNLHHPYQNAPHFAHAHCDVHIVTNIFWILCATLKNAYFDMRSKTICVKGKDRLKRKSLTHWTLNIKKSK